jgi:hypothetical protein
MSNAPENVRVLDDGRSIRVAPFTCAAVRGAVRCVVTRLRHGFVLSRTTLTRI